MNNNRPIHATSSQSNEEKKDVVPTIIAIKKRYGVFQTKELEHSLSFTKFQDEKKSKIRQ